LATAGYAKLILGSDQEAVTRCRHSIEINHSHPNTYFSLAAASA
jgi:hypothetical protein